MVEAMYREWYPSKIETATWTVLGNLSPWASSSLNGPIHGVKAQGVNANNQCNLPLRAAPSRGPKGPLGGPQGAPWGPKGTLGALGAPKDPAT